MREESRTPQKRFDSDSSLRKGAFQRWWRLEKSYHSGAGEILYVWKEEQGSIDFDLFRRIGMISHFWETALTN